MEVDLSGGLSDDHERFLVEQPADPEIRDAVNVWIHDDRGRFSVPRIGVERVGDDWMRPAVLANITFPDGRVLVGSTVGDAHDPLDDRGQATIMGSGPIEMRCLEPYRRWRLDYDGDAIDTNVRDQSNEIVAAGPRVPVAIQAELTMAVPPWIDSAEDLTNRRIDTGHRFRQVFTAAGALRVGDDEYRFTGSGLRIRRQLVRRMDSHLGHCWQSALFPSGRAFGYTAYPDRGDGSKPYREGFVYDGTTMTRAVPVEMPWLAKFAPEGENVTCRLDTRDGPVRIGGTTTMSAVNAGTKALATIKGLNRGTAARDMFLHQGGALYEWDGELAYGMIERSFPNSQVQR